MGVDLIVTIENSKEISLGEFIKKMSEDKWGRETLCDEEIKTGKPDELIPSWEEFEWKGNKYFTWIGSPRAKFVLWEIYEHELDDWERKEFRYTRVATFKAIKYAEEIAGGPVFAGLDVITPIVPTDCKPGEFYLPGQLDAICPNWREIAEEEI